MCTSVPHTPARPTLMSTSSSLIFGSGTSFSLNPGAAVSFTNAFTSSLLRCLRMKDECSGNLSLHFDYWKDRHHRCVRKVLRAKTLRPIFAFGYETQCTFVRLHCNQRGPVITSSWRDKMAAKKRGGRKAAKKGG